LFYEEKKGRNYFYGITGGGGGPQIRRPWNIGGRKGSRDWLSDSTRKRIGGGGSEMFPLLSGTKVQPLKKEGIVPYGPEEGEKAKGG